MTEEKQKKGNKILVVKALSFALVIALIVWVIWLLNNQHEERTSVDAGQDDLSSLECTAKEVKKDDDFLFASESTDSYEFTMKAIFNTDKLDKLTYEFNGTYASDKLAENMEAKLRAKYYKYMEQNNLGTEYLNPVLADTDDNLKISFYAERKKLTSAVAPVFMITRDEYAKTSNFSLENLKKLYEGKGFSCSTHK